MEQKINYLSISEINELIKAIFDNSDFFKNIWLKGEISNYKGRNKSGHIYFTLKDEKSSINAVLFKFDSFSLEFEPKNGDEVLVFGSISSYPPSGTYQIICRKVLQYGIGQDYLKKEMLKKKLFKEGLFDEEHKKELPPYPTKIAIITGKNSAAALDFEFNIKRRFPICQTDIYFSLVQGENASKDLAQNLIKVNENNYDLIIIGRGGGSSEDLSAFDDEMLVRTIFKLKTPIISAVGHEINKTLCDLVADKYASTPTGAAEIAVPNYLDIIEDLEQQKNYLHSLMVRHLTILENKLLNIKSKKYFQNIEALYDGYFQKLAYLKEKLDDKVKNYINNIDKQVLNYKKNLEILSPENILKKGYSIVKTKDNKIVSDINLVDIDQEIDIRVSNGTISTKVIKKEK